MSLGKKNKQKKLTNTVQMSLKHKSTESDTSLSDRFTKRRDRNNSHFPHPARKPCQTVTLCSISSNPPAPKWIVHPKITFGRSSVHHFCQSGNVFVESLSVKPQNGCRN